MCNKVPNIPHCFEEYKIGTFLGVVVIWMKDQSYYIMFVYFSLKVICMSEEVMYL